MGEPQRDAPPCQGAMRDDLLEVVGRTGVRQLPHVGGTCVQGRSVRLTSPMGRGERLAWDAGSRLRLRGLLHRAESANLGRRLSRLVASDQCPTAGQADSLPRQCRDVATAKGGG